MRKYIEGEVVNRHNKYFVRIKSKDDPHQKFITEYKLVNKSGYILFYGDKVKGYLQKNYAINMYTFYIEETNGDISISSFTDSIIEKVTTLVNEAEPLFNRTNRHVLPGDVTQKTMVGEIVLCRHIAAYYTRKYLHDQLSNDGIGKLYNTDRTSINYAVKNITNLRQVDKQLSIILKELDNQIESIYNNLKERKDGKE